MDKVRFTFSNGSEYTKQFKDKQGANQFVKRFHSLEKLFLDVPLEKMTATRKPPYRINVEPSRSEELSSED